MERRYHFRFSTVLLLSGLLVTSRQQLDTRPGWDTIAVRVLAETDDYKISWNVFYGGTEPSR
jgi:hypothetical protein